MEDIEKQKAEALENVKKTAEAAAKMTVEEAMKAVSEKMEEIAGKVGKSVTEDDFKKEIAELQARVKQIKQTTSEEKTAKSIKDAIADALVEGAEKLKNFRGEEKLVMKAVTDASWEAGALDHATSEVRSTLYNSPYSPLYLRNIFPNVATDMGTVIIPQIGAITGAAAEWERGTGELGADVAKPEVSPAYKDVTVPMKWIAGITTVNRELLLNVKYLQSSITNTLLYSSKGLFAAENKMITDYLATNAVAYAGSKTIALEKIIDAAFNQLLGNYMAPTHVLMNQADYLTYIKLNKASGSGEYDVPNDTLMGFFGTGLETAVQIVPVPSIVAGTAYVVSAPEFEFINRLAPEIQIAEQHDVNFAFNKVTFRVEEMAAFVAKNLNAMVKITF
jgi:hypothetical protein